MASKLGLPWSLAGVGLVRQVIICSIDDLSSYKVAKSLVCQSKERPSIGPVTERAGISDVERFCDTHNQVITTSFKSEYLHQILDKIVAKRGWEPGDIVVYNIKCSLQPTFPIDREIKKARTPEEAIEGLY